MNRLKKGDDVIVISGKNKGRRGTITSILFNRNSVIIEGINLIKKHVKANPNKGIEGGVKKIEAPIHLSNVLLYNPATKKGERIGFKFLENRKKVRYFKSNGNLVNQ